MDYPSTYTLAHTARCKLKLAADRPDRDLRFILGHAFTLDKLRLRLAEIEISSSDSDEEDYDDNDDHPTCTGNAADAPVAAEPHQVPRRISFTNTARPSVAPHRQRSPPPADQFSDGDSSGEDDSSGSSDDEDYATLDDELGLQRFGSAAAAGPPRRVPGLEADEDDDVDEVAEPSSPTEEELRLITGGDGSLELTEAYKHVAGCPCHGVEAVEKVGRVWEVPSKGGVRFAVVQVED